MAEATEVRGTGGTEETATNDQRRLARIRGLLRGAKRQSRLTQYLGIYPLFLLAMLLFAWPGMAPLGSRGAPAAGSAGAAEVAAHGREGQFGLVIIAGLFFLCAVNAHQYLRRLTGLIDKAMGESGE